MTTLNISLPKTMKSFIDEQVTEGSYSTASEYVRELIRKDKKHRVQEKLDRLLIEGLESGKPIEVNDAYWQKKKADLQERLK